MQCDTPDRGAFSMLKQLGLDFVDIKSERSFCDMIACCLVLDCLHMSTCYGGKVLQIEKIVVDATLFYESTLSIGNKLFHPQP